MTILHTRQQIQVLTSSNVKRHLKRQARRKSILQELKPQQTEVTTCLLCSWRLLQKSQVAHAWIGRLILKVTEHKLRHLKRSFVGHRSWVWTELCFPQKPVCRPLRCLLSPLLVCKEGTIIWIGPGSSTSFTDFRYCLETRLTSPVADR